MLFEQFAMRESELVSRAGLLHRIAGESARNAIYQSSTGGSLFRSAWSCGCVASLIDANRASLRCVICRKHHDAFLRALTQAAGGASALAADGADLTLL